MLAALLEELQRCRQPTGHAPSRAHVCLLPCEHCGLSTVGQTSLRLLPGASGSPGGSQAFSCFWPRGLRGHGEGRGVARQKFGLPGSLCQERPRALPLGVLGAGQAQIQAPSPGPLGIWSHWRLLGESPSALSAGHLQASTRLRA